MKEIKWESDHPSSLHARVGILHLACYNFTNRRGNNKWYAYVFFHCGITGLREGPYRLTAHKAKEDAVRIASEMLSDHHHYLSVEMKNFGLEPCFCE